ncbi:MAG: DegT/DnrJ/EryC1/StrS family aminotransferase [Desulfobacteraceae bacterium]|nr:DegT/DnrJ/EryC1/StrS family aminotransferase [Desulfobacteraceae bacterium]
MKEKLFINGGKKVRSKEFGYEAPIGKEEIRVVNDVLVQKRLSGFYKDFLGGEKVKEFEKRFAEYIGVKHAIAVNSGTSALHVAIAACGIGPGDEVIVPPFTFTATAASVLMNNAIPIFADIEPDTLCIDPDMIKDAITEKTKAIIPVHVYGRVAKMDAIKDIVAGKNIILIEDACQAPGCEYKGRKAGSIGDVGIFSFVETKNLVVGEGGMVTTDCDDIAERCRLIRNHGEVWAQGKTRQYLSNLLGYNFRMTEITAALGIEQLKKLDYLNGIRQKNASFLQDALNKFKGVEVMKFREGEVCHIFPVLFNEDEVGIPKDKFAEIVSSEGIPLAPGYPHPLYKNPIFQEKIAYGEKGCPYTCPFYGKNIDYKNLRCEVAEDVCERLLCIRQVYYPYGVEDMKDIVGAFDKVFGNLEVLR